MKSKCFRLSFVVLVVFVALTGLATTWGAKKTYTDDAKKAYEVSWYFVGDSQPDADTVSAEATKYLQKKIPNTSLKMFHYDWGTWFGRIPTMVAASEPFDIFFMAEWLKYWDWYNQGTLLPLNDLMAKYAPKSVKAIGPFHLQGCAINGVNYAFPVKKELAGAMGFLFNKKFVDKYKFDLNKIQKPEDLEPWLETIKKNEAEIIPFDPTSQGLINSMQAWERPAGDWVPGAMYQDDSSKGKFFNQIESPGLMRYSELTYAWAQKGYLSEDNGTDERQIQKRQNGFVFCRVARLNTGKTPKSRMRK